MEKVVAILVPAAPLVRPISEIHEDIRAPFGSRTPASRKFVVGNQYPEDFTSTCTTRARASAQSRTDIERTSSSAGGFFISASFRHFQLNKINEHVYDDFHVLF